MEKTNKRNNGIIKRAITFYICDYAKVNKQTGDISAIKKRNTKRVLQAMHPDDKKLFNYQIKALYLALCEFNDNKAENASPAEVVKVLEKINKIFNLYGLNAPKPTNAFIKNVFAKTTNTTLTTDSLLKESLTTLKNLVIQRYYCAIHDISIKVDFSGVKNAMDKYEQTLYIKAEKEKEKKQNKENAQKTKEITAKETA